MLCVFNRAYHIISAPSSNFYKRYDTRSSHRITPLPNGYRAIGQAFWKVRSPQDRFLLFCSSFFFTRCSTHGLEFRRPRNIIRPRSTIDEWPDGETETILATDLLFTVVAPIWSVRSDATKWADYSFIRRPFISRYEKKGEMSLCSSLIDEALGGRNVRRIALTFHPIDRKARSITRKLLNVIFSKLPTRWEGFYLARLG